jgi:predicted dehydrogenase
MRSNKIRIGVIGLGYLGKFHYQKYKASRLVKLTSVVDTNIVNHSLVTDKCVSKFKKYQDIVDHVDAVSIVTPTSTHFKIAKYFLEKESSCLVRKANDLKLSHRQKN